MQIGVEPPEGLITANEGSLYLQYDFDTGGNTAKFWVKLPGQDLTPFGWAEWFNWAGT